MNITVRIFAPVAFLSALTAAAPLAVSNGTVSFTAKGNMGMTCDGSTSAVKVDEDASAYTVTVQTGTLDSKLELRDKHIKERYLETPKFPTSVIVIDKACLALPESGDKAGECPGTFTLHGQTKPATVKFKAKVAGKVTEIDASFTAHMAQHGIEEVKWAMVKIKDDVEVHAKLTVTR